MAHNAVICLKRLVNELKPRNRRVMKRCFMTGKQCIFSSHVTESAPSELTGDNLSVFVVMPFPPNLETFYQWSLKPFLTQGYGLLESSIQRADEVRDIGYIICEKICRKIQESDLVLADISLANANVFYEIGLAYGLERPVVLMQNGNSNEGLLNDNRYKQSLGLPPVKGQRDQYVLNYPGVGALLPENENHKLEKYILRTEDRRISPSLVSRTHRISVLKVAPREEVQRQGAMQDAELAHPEIVPIHNKRHDIALSFDDALVGAIGVAMAEIRRAIDGKKKAIEKKELETELLPWEELVLNIPDDDDNPEWSTFAFPQFIALDGRNSFESIAQQIESSFCTIIDITNSDPLEYFWLGYCHARGLNAVPIFRTWLARSGEVATQEAHKEPNLAFDIRALWYAQYYENEPSSLKKQMREILEHLFERDLPDQQKRAFWDRFPPERKLKVFTGAIHNRELNREMVGDWDVRTVSELFSYLPSLREAMAIELVTPLYSPEEAFTRSLQSAKREATEQGKSFSEKDLLDYKAQWLHDFRVGIETHLKEASAIVVASPDVNPVTEYLLHKIYHVRTPASAFEECDKPNGTGFVVVKRSKPAPAKTASADDAQPKECEQPIQQVMFPRLFYTKKEGDTEERGFGMLMRDTLSEPDELFQQYYSQDECPADGFHLLGHLVVARYPLHSDTLVVLLNGVSGPATFALAQILTGGGIGTTRALHTKSEEMLREINRLLDDPKCHGVEVIIDIIITPPDSSDAVDRTYVDSRKVTDWGFYNVDDAKLKPLLR